MLFFGKTAFLLGRENSPGVQFLACVFVSDIVNVYVAALISSGKPSQMGTVSVILAIGRIASVWAHF